MPDRPLAFRSALIAFAKPPVEGKVKTRLVPAIGSRDAADLYRCFLRDAITQYERLSQHVRLYFGDGAIPAEFVHESERTSVHRQKGASLRERMTNAFLESFAAGFNAALIVGTDHPSLPDSFIELAFESLAEPMSVAIGPSEDGGYYLLGMNQFFPQLFSDMTYSHDNVFGETLDRALDLDARLTVLPEWYDIDTPAALGRLHTDLLENPSAAPETLRFLEGLLRR